MTDETPDLPDALADLLRSVPPADALTRDTHLSAALDAFDTAEPAPVRVRHVEFRRRVLSVAAAVALLGVAWGAGWATRGPGNVGTLATASPAAASTDSVPKGITPAATGPQCTHGTLQMIDSVFIGEYTNPSDNRSYLVFTFSGRLEFVDKDTCTPVELTTVTTTP